MLPLGAVPHRVRVVLLFHRNRSSPSAPHANSRADDGIGSTLEIVFHRPNFGEFSRFRVFTTKRLTGSAPPLFCYKVHNHLCPDYLDRFHCVSGIFPDAFLVYTLRGAQEFVHRPAEGRPVSTIMRACCRTAYGSGRTSLSDTGIVAGRS
jgi:hypothetical protein